MDASVPFRNFPFALDWELQKNPDIPPAVKLEIVQFRRRRKTGRLRGVPFRVVHWVVRFRPTGGPSALQGAENVFSRVVPGQFSESSSL